MSRRLEGRRAIVTGGAQGIGLATARRFVEEGARVLLVDRNAATLDAAVAGEAGFASLATDLRDEAAPAAIMAAADELLGGVDILVNNAGIAGSTSVGKLEESRWQEVIDVNLTAAFRLSRLAVVRMAAAGFGRMVNIASMMGVVGFRENSDYAVSKAGIIALTRSLAADYGRSGVTANAIAPGPILTPLGERMISDRPAWYLRGALHGKPIERHGRPEDVAAAALFFASDEAGFVTGQVLGVDGGMTATRYVPDRYPDEPA